MSSTADTDEEIEVTADGLTVRKTFAADEFPVPAIRFEIESDRDEQVAFRLSEEIPEEFPMDKVGFHPDYNSDDWTAFQDNHVEFTGELEAGDQFVTVYGIRIDDESEADAFLTEPDIVEVSAADEHGADAAEVDDDVLGDIVSEDRNQPVKDMIAGESDSVPGLEDEDEDVEDEDDEGEPELDLDLGDVDPEPEPVEDDDTDDDDDAPEIDLGFEEDDVDDADGDDEDDGPEIDLDLDEGTDDETSPDAAVAVAPPADDSTDDAIDDTDDAIDDTDDAIDDTDDAIDDTDDATDDADDATDDGDDPAIEGSVAERLVAELREDGLDDEDRKLLRETLDLEASGPTVAKVDHLQSRVEEVAAYTAALETFLEENGTGKQLIDRLQTGMDDLEADLEDLEGRVDANDERLETVEGDVDSVTTEIETVGDDVAAVEDTVDDLDEDVSTLEADVHDLDDDLENVEDDLEDLDDELEDVRDDVTEIQEWRDELGSMFSN